MSELVVDKPQAHGRILSRRYASAVPRVFATLFVAIAYYVGRKSVLP